PEPPPIESVPTLPMLTSSTLPPLVPVVVILDTLTFPLCGAADALPEITVTLPPVEEVELVSIAPIEVETGAETKTCPAGPPALRVQVLQRVSPGCFPFKSWDPDPPLPALAVAMSPSVRAEVLAILIQSGDVC